MLACDVAFRICAAVSPRPLRTSAQRLAQDAETAT
jgi:hypothetical protein